MLQAGNRLSSVFKLRMLVVVWLLFVESTAIASENVHVAIASNFLPTFKLLQGEFESRNQVKVLVSAGSTGKLYAQIIHGAPYDVFLAADQARPEILEQQGLIIENSRFTYAIGQLALYHPGIDENNFTFLQLTNSEAHLSMANPKTAPYGLAAKNWLQQQGLWLPLRKQIVTGENVGQALLFVQSGNAQFGLVSLSNLIALKKTQYTPIPNNMTQPIIQQGVRLSDRDSGRLLIAFLQSDIAKNLIEQTGYSLP